VDSQLRFLGEGACAFAHERYSTVCEATQVEVPERGSEKQDVAFVVD
jgi:hypothetical protein